MNEQTDNFTPKTEPPASAAVEAKALAGEAMDRLAQKDRVLTEATMASKSKPLTDEQIFGIRQNAQDYLKKYKVAQNTVAAQTGLSASSISEWLCGRYLGNVEKVAHVVNDWMERDAQRRAARRNKDFIPTKMAEKIRSIVRLADKRMMMAAIVAPSGCGKTYVARVLAEEMRGVYLDCQIGLPPREFVLSLAQELGRESCGGTRAAAHRWIVQALAGTGRIIFLDEAHKLPIKTFDCVRAVHDGAHVPIVMLGTAEILRFVNDRGQGRGQFSSRSITCDLFESVAAARGGGGRRGGAAAQERLFSAEEVRAFFDSKKIKLHREALELLCHLANLPDWGCLRLIENVCESVFDIKPDTAVVGREDVMMALHLLRNSDAGRMLRRAEDEDEADADVAPAAIVA